MKKCTDTVVDWMMRYNVIHDEDKELYKYALHSVLLFVSPFILAGSIGFFVGSVKHGILLILPFIVLRKFSGGYHAKYSGIRFSTVSVHNVINACTM